MFCDGSKHIGYANEYCPDCVEDGEWLNSAIEVLEFYATEPTNTVVEDAGAKARIILNQFEAIGKRK